MKKAKIFYLSLAICLSQGVKAQTTQSAMYDAIALMNASNRVNAMFTANPHAYNIIDPLTGQVVYSNVTSTPSAITNDTSVSSKIILAILARNAGLTTTDYASVKAAYETNPFMGSLFGNASHLSIRSGSTMLATYGNITTSTASGAFSLGNIGGNVVNGVADLIEKKAMEELSVSVFQKLQNFLSNYPEFNVLFPRTVALLHPVAAYDYAKTLKSLKAALQQDLDELPMHLPWLYTLKRYQLLNKKVPELTLIFAASQVLYELHGKNSFWKSFHDLDTASFMQEPNNYVTVIKLAQVMTTSFRKKLISDPENGDYPYFSLQDIQLATHNQPGYMAELGTFYLGLLYQQTANLQFYDQNGPHELRRLIARFVGVTGDVMKKLVSSSDGLNSFEQQLVSLKQRDDGLKQTGANIISADRFALYNNLLVTAMKAIAPFADNGPNNEPWQFQVNYIITYWPPFSESGVQLMRDISDRNYNLAVSDLSGMLNNLSAYLANIRKDNVQKAQVSAELTTLLAAQIQADNARLTTITNEISALPSLQSITDQNQKAAITLQLQILTQQKSMLTVELQNLQWESDNGKVVLSNFNKIVNLIDLLASLSQAGDSQEVESILENYVLPAGSSRVKKETAFNISLNSYVGGYYRPSGTGYANAYGLTAPIGFDFSTGLGKGGSFSLLLGIVDIGGVIQYKLNNQGQYEQNINFAGLVSPSVHFVYGFGGYIPLSVGLGAQWTTPPTTGSNNVSLRGHFNSFLAVDVPLFNLSVVKHQK